MRRASHDNDWLFDGDKFVGINLGWCFVSEHEWGIKNLQHTLNISEDLSICGIDRRRVGDVDPENVFFDKKKGILIVHDSKYTIEHLNEGKFKPGDFELQIYEEKYDTKQLATAWDGGSFGIHVKKKDIEKLQLLYDALTTKNAAIWLGGKGDNPFSNAGLIIAIFDRIPASGAKTMKDADEDYNKLMKASEKTGIKKKIDKVNEKEKVGFWGRCGYFALSPRWASEEDKKHTKFPVVYWLNPHDQQNNNCGWFTVEELREWAKGEGPVPKKKNEEKAS